MRILVTGGAGFIGANLARHLLERGHDVVVLDDLSTGDEGNLDGLDVRFVRGSILDPAAVEAAFEDAEALVHLAARASVPRSLAEPAAAHEVNATGTLRVLEAARRRALHTLVASSSSVYGDTAVLPKSEELVPLPLSPYGATKLATEQYALAWQASYGLPVLAFRFFNVFGPLQRPGHAYAAVIPAFVEAALAGRALPVHGDGLQSRDFTAVASVAQVLALAVERRASSTTPVNLAFGSRLTLLDVVAELSAVLGRDLDVEHLPPRAGDVRHSQADQTRLRRLFPDAQPVPFSQGLRATVEWFRTRA